MVIGAINEYKEQNRTYQSFDFVLNNNMKILLCYTIDTKEIKYISISTNRSKIYNTLGKDFESFDKAKNNYKNAKIRQAIEEVEQYYQKYIKVAIIEEKDTIEEYYNNPILLKINKEVLA